MVTDNAGVSRTQVSPETARTQRKWWIIGGILITALSAAVIAIGIYYTRGQIHHEVRTYEIVDDQTATLSFEVYRPADTAVVCRARAIALDFANVGTVDVTIPADASGGARNVIQDVTIRTTTRANTATISKCVPEGTRSQ